MDHGDGTRERRQLGTVSFVLVSYVFRLRPNGLRVGYFTGEIESVATGHSFPIGSVDQLIAYMLESVDEELSTTRAVAGAVGVDP